MSETTFRTVLRGYDPLEVDKAVGQWRGAVESARRESAEQTVAADKLHAALQAASLRVEELTRRVGQLEEAERSAAPPTYADLGARITSILTLAQEEAAQLRGDAAGEADQLRTETQREAERLLTAANIRATELRSKAEADAAVQVENARRQADELLDAADREAAARREEAEAVYEHQRARAAAAAAEFETTLAERRDKSAADFTRALAAQDQALAAAQDQLETALREAEGVRTAAHGEASDVLGSAREEAHQLLSAAKERAEKVRRESDRELAAAASRRDAITAQLSNVRQMLGTLGGTAILNPLTAPAGDDGYVAAPAALPDDAAAPEVESEPSEATRA